MRDRWVDQRTVEAIENAYRIASEDVLDALSRAHLNPDDGPARYALNAALVRKREIEQLRRPSGVLQASAIDAEKLAGEALSSAYSELRTQCRRLHWVRAQLVMAGRSYSEALLWRLLAVLWRAWERIQASLRKHRRGW